VNPILALAVVLVAGLVVTRLPRIPRPTALRLDLVASAGLPLVVLGILLGPVLHLLDGDVLKALAPAAAFGIAWIGAAFGASLGWRYVRKIPRALWLLAGCEALAVLAVTGLLGWELTRLLPALGAALRPALPTVFALASIAVVTGPAAVAMTAHAVGIRRSVRQAFEIAAWLDTAAGAVAFILVLTIYHPREPAGGVTLGWISWLGLAVASGLLFGFLYLGLTHFAKRIEERDLALLGVILFGAGVGYAADLSPFVICGVAAVVIANRSPHRHAAIALLRAWEHPVSAILLIFAGALVTFPTFWLLPAALILVWGRAAARWLAVRVARVPLGLSRILPPDLGLAGVAQGGVAVALALNFFILYGAASGGPVVTIALIGLGVNLLMAPAAMSRALRPAPALTTPPVASEVTG
jgi:hypothetical protein